MLVGGATAPATPTYGWILPLCRRGYEDPYGADPSMGYHQQQQGYHHQQQGYQQQQDYEDVESEDYVDPQQAQWQQQQAQQQAYWQQQQRQQQMGGGEHARPGSFLSTGTVGGDSASTTPAPASLPFSPPGGQYGPQSPQRRGPPAALDVASTAGQLENLKVGDMGQGAEGQGGSPSRRGQLDVIKVNPPLRPEERRDFSTRPPPVRHRVGLGGSPARVQGDLTRVPTVLPQAGGVVQCYILRSKRTGVYKLYLDEGDHFLLASKQRNKGLNKSANYLISVEEDDLDRRVARVAARAVLRASGLRGGDPGHWSVALPLPPCPAPLPCSPALLPCCPTPLPCPAALLPCCPEQPCPCH